jgi:hypothetical protein
MALERIAVPSLPLWASMIVPNRPPPCSTPSIPTVASYLKAVLCALRDGSKMEVSVTLPPSVQRDGKESKATNTLTGTPSLVPKMK